MGLNPVPEAKVPDWKKYVAMEHFTFGDQVGASEGEREGACVVGGVGDLDGACEAGDADGEDVAAAQCAARASSSSGGAMETARLPACG